MHESIKKDNYNYDGFNNMKISQKLRMRQEESNTGYSSRGDSLSDAQSQYIIITSASATTTKTSPQASESGRTVQSGNTVLALQLPGNNKYITRSIGDISRENSTMLGTNNKHTRCMSPSYSCCQRNDMFMRINEELLQQKRDLEERNQNLSEEIHVSRRFYQGTLADLTAQLSIAENRIKYLKEVVSTQEEALRRREKEQGNRLYSSNRQDSLEHFTQPPSVTGTLKPSPKNLPMHPRGGYYPIESARSTTSSTGSVSSESSTARSSRLGKNFAKIKEQLLEKNQNLKTDIELLKFKSEIPKTSSVPALNNIRSNQELPAIKSDNANKKDRSPNTTHVIESDREPSSLSDGSIALDKYIVSQMNQEVRQEQKKKSKVRQK